MCWGYVGETWRDQPGSVHHSAAVLTGIALFLGISVPMFMVCVTAAFAPYSDCCCWSTTPTTQVALISPVWRESHTHGGLYYYSMLLPCVLPVGIATVRIDGTQHTAHHHVRHHRPRCAGYVSSCSNTTLKQTCLCVYCPRMVFDFHIGDKQNSWLCITAYVCKEERPGNGGTCVQKSTVSPALQSSHWQKHKSLMAKQSQLLTQTGAAVGYCSQLGTSVPPGAPSGGALTNRPLKRGRLSALTLRCS